MDSTTLKPKPSYYCPQLDGLRFGAALLVFFHHAPGLRGLGWVSEYGWIGVDLFLSISAFLLTRLLVMEFNASRNIDITKFFIRRSLRIWPLYFFYATLVCILAIFAQDLELGTVSGWWLSHLTFTNNLMTALNGYAPISYSAHLWTISLEEQAYVILPLLLLLYLRSGLGFARLRVFFFAAITLLLVMRLGFVLTDAPHPFIWVLPLRADSFIFGAVAALLIGQRTDNWFAPLMIVGALIMCSVILFPNIGETGYYQVFGYTIVALGCTLVTISSQATVFDRSILASRPLRYLGKISFGIYIYHVLCIDLSRLAFDALGVSSNSGQFGFGLLLTIAMAGISYEILEKPFLRLKERYSDVRSRPY